MDIPRLRTLAGITEASQMVDPDEQDRFEQARLAREQRIVTLIRIAFARLAIAIAEHGVFYNEDDERRADVILDDDAVSVGLLAQLPRTGLAQDFMISAGRDSEHGTHVLVSFHVVPNLDAAM